MAITWVNQGSASTDSDNFANLYGIGTAAVARQIVSRAISDWNAVITDFNYDGDNNPATVNTYSLNVTAGVFPFGLRGQTANFTTNAAGLPTASTINMDDNGGGSGWFFDQTPLDDAEFTAVANSLEDDTGAPFHASFVDVTTSNAKYNDFYRTIVHEIGHAVGIFLDSNAGFNRLFNMTTDIGDDPKSGDPADKLRTFNGSNGTVTLTRNGGGHLYEGDATDAPAIVSHPNELMNPGRTVPPPGGFPNPTTRQFISDLDARLLGDAYGYTVVLPSTLNTAYATFDSQIGTLLVQGRAGSQNDTINIAVIGPFIRVQANGTTELISKADVTQIVIAGNGGTDSITVAAALAPIRKDVQYVVSSNEDSASADTLGDGIVDLDAFVPGNQVALRAAIVDANGTAAGSSRSIYVPRGNYQLTISGAGSDTEGDLDINRHLTIIGAGAGATVIHAANLATRDRIFEIVGGTSASLDLSRVTISGGLSTAGGGAVLVNNNTNSAITELRLTDATVVGNVASSSNGGGVLLQPDSSAVITRSVVTANTASSGGGIYASGSTPTASRASAELDQTIVAKNTASTGGDLNSAPGTGGTSVAGLFTSSGGNIFTSTAGSNLASGGLQTTDYVDAVDYVVTSAVDSFDDTDNARALSLREAVNQANVIAGLQTLWLPAWTFVLTRDRATFSGGSLTDVSAAYGDLDVIQSLVIRGSGIEGATYVKWRSGVVDAVFELIGDFNGDGITSQDDGSVSGNDFLIWQQTLGSTTDLRADADDNGVIQGADNDLWSLYFGNTLTLTNLIY